MSDPTYFKFNSEKERDDALKAINDDNVKPSYTHKNELYIDGTLNNPEKTGEFIKLFGGNLEK